MAASIFTSMSNPKSETCCWAACLGNCSTAISGEHLISESLWKTPKKKNPMLRIEGFPWCQNQGQSIGLSSFVANILCKKHNSDLSALDTSALRFATDLRDAAKLCRQRSAEPSNKRWEFKEYNSSDARHLERWFLKTALNLAHVGVGALTQAQQRYLPPQRLVRMAYGIDQIEYPNGLYAMATLSEGVRDFDVIQFAPIWREQQFEGGLFMWRDFRFVLWCGDREVPSRLAMPGLTNSQWPPSECIYHIERYNFDIDGMPSHSVRLKWDIPSLEPSSKAVG